MSSAPFRPTSISEVNHRIKTIDGQSVLNIRKIVEAFAEEIGNKGGVLKIYDSRHRQMALDFNEGFGDFPNPKQNRSKFENLSEDRAKVLHAETNKLSICEGYVVKDEKFGKIDIGDSAIRTNNNRIISCSGAMTKHEAEATCLCLALCFNWITEKTAEEIVFLSGSKKLSKAKKLVKNIRPQLIIHHD